MTIYVSAPKTFAKVLDPAELAEKDTIILATIYNSAGVVAGPRDNKKLTIAQNAVSVTAEEAYADDALRLVLGKVKNKEGFTLTIDKGATLAAESGSNDIITASDSKNKKYWQFVADGDKGLYVQNVDLPEAIFKYYATNSAIKYYAASGAVYVYAYVRHYVDPTPTAVENTNADTKAVKVFQNGHILILRNGEVYDITGRKVTNE